MTSRKLKPCPECGTKVRIDRLEAHMKKIHPEADRSGLLTEEERTDLEESRRRVSRGGISLREKGVYIVGLLVVIGIILMVVMLQPRPVETGQPAPDFTLKDTDGNTVRLSDLRGRVVLLDLMDVDCTYCQRETANTLVPLHERYGDRVVFISVDVQLVGSEDTVAKINAFKSQYGSTWRYCLDTDGVRGKYGVTATPTTCIIDRSGTIAYLHSGLSSESDLSTHLDAVLG